MMTFAILVGWEREIKEENVKLKEKVTQLQEEIDRLNSIISKLQQTDNYYYQMSVNSRQNKKYEESNRYLEEMIERFPKSPLVTEARKLIKKNNNDIAQSLYDKAVSSQKAGQYHRSNELADELLAKFPKSSLAYKAKKIKAINSKKIREKKEADLRKGCDLELITWSWSTTAGGSYVEARGQVKNISGRSLRNVEAVVSFYDRNGNFITCSSALIEFNPILAGQTSLFTVMETYNPAMKKASVQFKFLMGGTIPTYHKKK
jgi:tetratricopeptide (TPR) repeat protein